MESKYTIKFAEIEDEEQIVRLARNVANEFTRAYLGDKIVDEYINSGLCDEDIKKEISNTLILSLENEVIGLMIWKENKMQGLMVNIKYHGSGAAQYFCNQIMPEKLKIYDVLYLECFDKNARAIAFYKKTGWNECETIKDNMTDGYRILFKFTK